jgi:hypothetical protein
MFTALTAWSLSNFSLLMLIIAVFFSMVEWVIHKKVSTPEIFFRWVALLAIGGSGIYTFILHAFFPAISAAAIGWQVSPFQFEVAMADLALGVLGILSFGSSYGFRRATVIAATILLWGDAIGHFYHMIKLHNYTNGNSGSWFWMDIILPLILIICMLKIRPKQYTPLFQTA